jgi:hypothetical protein
MKSLKRIRNRHKRCYELAMKVMLDEPGADKLTLVHGYTGLIPDGVDLFPSRGHAWIELHDGRIYDVVDDQYLTMDEYVARWNCIKVVDRYTKVEAATKVTVSGHTGPWREAIPQIDRKTGKLIGWQYYDNTTSYFDKATSYFEPEPE